MRNMRTASRAARSGSLGTGRPRGTSPTTASPKRSAPIAATTTAAATITISTQGQRGCSARPASSAATTTALRIRVAGSTSCRCVATYAISAKVLPDGTDIPVILPSWLTIMSTAMPAM